MSPSNQELVKIFLLCKIIDTIKIILPISSLADDFDLKVVDTTGSRHWMSCPHRRRVLVVLPAPCSSQPTHSISPLFPPRTGLTFVVYPQVVLRETDVRVLVFGAPGAWQRRFSLRDLWVEANQFLYFRFRSRRVHSHSSEHVSRGEALFAKKFRNVLVERINRSEGGME